jgi:uncharacterized protein (DUF2062 family)
VNEPPAPARSTLRTRLATTKRRLGRLWRRLRGGSLSPGRAAASVAVGLFVGCLPLYGVQFALVLAVCMPLRLDVALAYVVTHVANPLTFPFFLSADMEVGSLILTGRHATLGLTALKRLGFIAGGAQVLLGSVVVGGSLAAVGALVVWVLVKRVQDRRERDLIEACRRTVLRYESAPDEVRSHLGKTLRHDPALRELLRIDGNFGRAVDTSAGYGQVGICLLELGRATSVIGIEASPSRVAIANGAGHASTRFECADLAVAPFERADTFLFLGSLLEMHPSLREEVLARAVAALDDGGRIIVREPPGDEAAKYLESAGLRCATYAPTDPSVTKDALVVAERPSPESLRFPAS